MLLASFAVSQVPPRPGPRPGQPKPILPRIEPKLPLPDKSKPILDPLASRSVLLRRPLKPAQVVTPGDEVELDPPAKFDLAKSSIQLENQETKELFELPVCAFPRVTKTPSKFTHGNVRLPAMSSQMGFVAPQVPRGKYSVFYVQDNVPGPRTSFEIRPKLLAAGRRFGVVDGRITVIVRPVGPSITPKKLRTLVQLRAPGQPAGPPILSNVVVQPEPFRPTIRLSNFTPPLAYGGMDSQRADESSRAEFTFDLRQAGNGSASFSSDGFDPVSRAITVRARNVPPEVEEPGRKLRLVGIGDSIMWGQGLKEPNKFTFKVADSMRGLTGRQVDRFVFAHSGGTVLPKNQADESRRLPGEVPVWFPSGGKQTELAAEALNGKSADVVLIDGAINDIDIMKIMSPFLDSRDEIRAATRAMRPAVRDMLVSLGRTFEFRKSLIVYTGYYPIISADSQVELMAAGFATALALAPLPGATVGAGLSALVIEGILIARKATIVAQNQLFYNEARAMLLGAISEAKNELGSNAEDRILYIEPGFTSKQAFAGENTRLWTFGIEDEVAGQRAIDGAPFALESPQFAVASMGHPNITGAQRYADAINELLRTAANRAIWDSTQPRKAMTATLDRAIQIPANATGIELDIRVTARDPSSGQNLTGNVFINGEFAGRTGDSIRHFFRRVNAQNPKPAILVARPGYQDGVVSYEIR